MQLVLEGLTKKITTEKIGCLHNFDQYIRNQ